MRIVNLEMPVDRAQYLLKNLELLLGYCDENMPDDEFFALNALYMQLEMKLEVS